MSRIQGDLEFSKNWENDEDFPTREYNETVVRGNIQLLFDETKDYINDIVTPAVNDNMERIENMGGGGSVSHDQIGDNAVWENNIKNYAVTEYKYGNSSIPTTALKDGSITSAKFNTASVNEYVEGRITAYGTATQTKNGLMSATDKAILDGTRAMRYFVGSAPLSSIGYIPMATITIQDSYANMPMKVTVMSRNFARPVTVLIKFTNLDSTDPSLESLTHHGGDLTFGMYKESAGTWTLYVRKTGAYDEIHVVDFFLGGYMSARVTWSWRSGADLVSSLPSGSITSTRYIEPDAYTLAANPSGRPTTANYNYHDSHLRYFLATNSMTEGKPPIEGQILHMAWDNVGWDVQLALGAPGGASKQPRLYIRSADATGEFGEWIPVYCSTNMPPDVTTSAHGLMTAADKTKLNGIATGAEVNQNAFSAVKVGNTTVYADGKSDTLTLTAGSNITLTPYASDDTITIAATNTTYSAATTSAAGLMSAADKTKLNGIATGATANTIDTSLSSSSTNAVQNKVINTALAAKAPLASPALTGTPTAPTADVATNSTQIATTAFVKNVLSNQIKNGRAKVEIGSAGVWLASDGVASGDEQASLGIYGGDDGNSEIIVRAEGLYPGVDNHCMLGYASKAWKSAYSYNWGSGSDRRMKQDINYDMSKYLDVFDSLKPCEFRYKDLPNEVHTGIIAQDVLDTMNKAGIEKSAAIETENDAGLLYARYDEFIGILIAKVQDLQRQVDELKAGGN